MQSFFTRYYDSYSISFHCSFLQNLINNPLHSGKPFVLPSVRAAEEKLLSQNLNHEYLPTHGCPHFRQAAKILAFGEDSVAVKENLVASAQSISGYLHVICLGVPVVVSLYQCRISRIILWIHIPRYRENVYFLENHFQKEIFYNFLENLWE